MEVHISFNDDLIHVGKTPKGKCVFLPCVTLHMDTRVHTHTHTHPVKTQTQTTDIVTHANTHVFTKTNTGQTHQNTNSLTHFQNVLWKQYKSNLIVSS